MHLFCVRMENGAKILTQSSRVYWANWRRVLEVLLESRIPRLEEEMAEKKTLAVSVLSLFCDFL